MLEIYKVTDLLDVILERMKKFHQREGYCFPSLILLNHGDPIYMPGYEKDTIVSIETDELPRFNIYKTMIALRVSNDKDENEIQTIANEIAKQYNPDAIALIMQCLYKSKTNKNENSISLQTDPDVIRVVHSCAYNGPEKGIIKLIPYINKGKIDTAIEKKFDILFSESAWELENDDIKPRISNPYK